MTPPGRRDDEPPKRLRSVTRERVLDAADRLFETKGFRAVSIKEIASESGYTTGALYSNFDSKAALYMAVFERRLHQRRRLFEEAFRASREGRTIGDLAETLGIGLIPTSPRNLAIFEFVAEALKDETLAPQLLELQISARSILREVLVANLSDAEPSLPMDKLVVLTTCLLSGIGITVALDPTLDADTLLRDGIRVLLRQPLERDA